MRFIFEGRKYRFFFHYPEPKHLLTDIGPLRVIEKCHGEQREKMVGDGVNERVYLERTLHATECHLQIADPDGPKGWREILVHTAWSGGKDQFCRAVGRDVAIGKFMHHNPFVKYESIRDEAMKHVGWKHVWGEDEIRGAGFYQTMLESWWARKRETIVTLEQVQGLLAVFNRQHKHLESPVGLTEARVIERASLQPGRLSGTAQGAEVG